MKWSLLHPQFDFGVQVVSGPLMDGLADRDRVQLLDLESDGSLKLFVIPVEDLIADRMSQALAGARIDRSMQNQAVMLYRFAVELDKAYLDKRIGVETADNASLETLENWVRDATDIA